MARAWTNERLIFDGDDYYRDILNAIESARESIDFESYIFDDDPVGLKFERALTAAASRGIRVRFLVDGIGSRTWIERRAEKLAQSGVEVRIYHPLRFYAALSRGLNRLGIGLRLLEHGRYIISRLNRRNHRKLVVIDSKIAWAGSLNVSAVHSAEFSGREKAWRDTGVRTEGAPIEALANGFEYAFKRSHDLEGRRSWGVSLLELQGRRRLRSSFVRQNFTIGLRQRGFHEFLRRLGKAKRRIWITNAYLAPSSPVLKALSRAARRGVDVRVLVPSKSDVFFMPWVAGSHYPALLKNGVRIFEFLPRFLHAKSVLIDNWATVGSSNLNGRSLKNDLEVDIVIRTPATVRELAAQFERDLRESEEIRSSARGPRALIGRLILFLMRDWI